jgi:hypothetical protein
MPQTARSLDRRAQNFRKTRDRRIAFIYEVHTLSLHETFPTSLSPFSGLSSLATCFDRTGHH